MTEDAIVQAPVETPLLPPAPANEPTAAKPHPARAPQKAPKERGSASWSSGRERDPAEVNKAKKAAAFVREAKTKTELVRKLVAAAIPEKGANTREVAKALAKLVRRDHGVTLGAGALRHLLELAADAGLVRHRRHGNATRWFVADAPPKKAVPAKRTTQQERDTPVPQAVIEAVHPAEDVPLELEVMAATNALIRQLDALAQHRVIVWLAARFEGAGSASSVDSMPAQPLASARGTASAKPAVQHATGHRTSARSAKKAPSKPDVRRSPAPPAVTAAPGKGDVADLLRVLAAKKPASGPETFLVLLQHLTARKPGGVPTGDVSILCKTAKVLMKNPSDTGNAATRQGLVRKSKGLWTLTAAGVKRLKELPRK